MRKNWHWVANIIPQSLYITYNIKSYLIVLNNIDNEAKHLIADNMEKESFVKYVRKTGTSLGVSIPSEIIDVTK